MVIASYIWMKWYALLQFTASASYFIQQPFISFPAELFRNKFRHLINSWSDSGRNTGKKPSLCRFTLFKIIFHNKGAIGAALSQQKGQIFLFLRPPLVCGQAVTLFSPEKWEKDRRGVSDQSSGESLEPGCAKLFSPTSSKARGKNKFVPSFFAVLLSGFKKLQFCIPA